jgi:hypothetical protein
MDCYSTDSGATWPTTYPDADDMFEEWGEPLARGMVAQPSGALLIAIDG